MAALWLNRVVIIALGWLAVSCITALIFSQVIAYGKRREARARQEWRSSGSQQWTGVKPVRAHAATTTRDIQATVEKHDAGA